MTGEDDVVEAECAPITSPSTSCVVPGENVTFPIFIPSKGRWKNQKGTAAQLIASRVPFTLVVEPQELDSYDNLLRELTTAMNNSNVAANDQHEASDREEEFVHHRRYVVKALPLSNQGVSYVRNFILHTLAPSNGWFWIMDDDIQGFHRGVNRVNHSISASEMLHECWKRMKQYPDAAVFSIDYPFYAWQYDDAAAAINSYNNIAVMMNRSLLPSDIHYRFRIREDYDFTLQVILSGKTTVRFRNLSFRVPRMATAPGGMTDYYEKQKSDIAEQNKLFIEMWPSVSREVIKGTGAASRLDINVKWIALKPQNCSDPAAILRSKTPINVSRSDKPTTEAAQSSSSRRKRQRSSSSSADSSVESESDESDEDDVPIARTAKKAPAVRVPRPPREKTLPGWKGFAIEKYRDPLPETIQRAGLVRIPDEEVKVGHVVLIIPFDLDLPSVVRACVVEVTRYPPPKRWNWSAVIEKMRGAPVQTVSSCYRLEDESADIAFVASALDDVASDQVEELVARGVQQQQDC